MSKNNRRKPTGFYEDEGGQGQVENGQGEQGNNIESNIENNLATNIESTPETPETPSATTEEVIIKAVEEVAKEEPIKVSLNRRNKKSKNISIEDWLSAVLEIQSTFERKPQQQIVEEALLAYLNPKYFKFVDRETE